MEVELNLTEMPTTVEESVTDSSETLTERVTEVIGRLGSMKSISIGEAYARLDIARSERKGWYRI